MSSTPCRSTRLPRRSLAVLAASAAATLAAALAGCGDTLWDKATETYSATSLNAATSSYDAASASWTARAFMPTGIVCETGVVAPSGRCYVVGGGTSIALRFDPVAATGTGQWLRLPDLPEARAQAVAVAAGSMVCVTSGFLPGGVSGYVDMLDDAAATPAWKRMAMPVKRYEAVVVGLPDRLLVIGGRDENGTPGREIWQLMPVTSTAFWQPIGLLSVERCLAGAFVLPGPKVHIVSGHKGDGVALTSEEVIDIGSSSLLPAVTIPNGRIAPECVVANGKAYVFDSRTYDVSVTGRLDRFDPAGAGSGWTQRASHPRPRSGAAIAALPDGRLLVAGGLERRETTIEAVLYDDGADTWTVTTGLPIDGLGGFFPVLAGRATYIGGINVKEKRRKLKTNDFLGI